MGLAYAVFPVHRTIQVWNNRNTAPGCTRHLATLFVYRNWKFPETRNWLMKQFYVKILYVVLATKCCTKHHAAHVIKSLMTSLHQPHTPLYNSLHYFTAINSPNRAFRGDDGLERDQSPMQITTTTGLFGIREPVKFRRLFPISVT